MTEGKVKEITPQAAWKILQDNAEAVLLDVRSSMEYMYVGHPSNALHIPWMEAPAWMIDPEFVTKVRLALRQKLGADRPPESCPVLTLCRSGQRSLAAAEALVQHGFTHTYNISFGFEGELDNNKHRSSINGWRQAGLPWEQS